MRTLGVLVAIVALSSTALADEVKGVAGSPVQPDIVGPTTYRGVAAWQNAEFVRRQKEQWQAAEARQKATEAEQQRQKRAAAEQESAAHRRRAWGYAPDGSAQATPLTASPPVDGATSSSAPNRDGEVHSATWHDEPPKRTAPKKNATLRKPAAATPKPDQVEQSSGTGGVAAAAPQPAAPKPKPTAPQPAQVRSSGAERTDPPVKGDPGETEVPGAEIADAPRTRTIVLGAASRGVPGTITLGGGSRGTNRRDDRDPPKR